MTRSRSELMASLIDDVAHLSKPYDHQEPTDSGRTHVSRHPGLLSQLYSEVYESTPSSDAEGGSKSILASSKAPINDELLGLLLEAAALSAKMVEMCNGRVYRSVNENFYQLPSLLTNATDELVEHVSGRVSYYRNQLELRLTWRDQPRKIQGFCPACGMKNCLVVQMDHYGPSSAKCVKCRAEWDKSTLGVLAGSLHETPKNHQKDN